ncbi:MAG: hypothetical protein E2O29_01460 [Deltaproteobacteria bacterium]|nr:MAG: hypothetical protein E2O29_01460 [Deltaproteobacteria bacterium]
MNLLSVSLNNFLSHKLTHVDFPEGLIGLVGLNGSGKSALVKESVTWALWGKSRIGGAGDDLIHYGESSCTAVIKFDVNGKIFKVLRKRTLGKKTELSFHILNSSGMVTKELSRPVLKNTQEEINKVLGMNYDTFRNSCCIEQGEADSFSKLSPKEAAQVMLDILQLNMYDKYKKECIDKFMQSNTQKDKLDIACGYLEERLHQISDVKSIQKSKQTELSKILKDYENTKKDYKKMESKCSSIQEEYNSYVLRIKELDMELRNIDQNISRLSSQAAALDLLNEKCPICYSNIDKSNKDIIKENLRKEYQDILDKKMHIDDSKKIIIVKFKDTNKKLITMNFVIKSHKNKITGLHGEASKLEGELESLKNPAKELKDIISKLSDHRVIINQLIKEQEIYSSLSQAFSHKGIPLLIIDNLINELDLLVNENLKLLSDLPISIKFVTQRESVNGDLVDTFKITIQDGLEVRSYFNYSGGERMIIDLAIRLGLSELLSRRNNFKVETLIIDEGLGSLDEAKQHNFIKTLELLTSRFKRIVLITHTEAKQYLNHCIELTKDDEISVVKT